MDTRIQAALVSLCLISVDTVAQTVPDAGALQQQIERERLQQLPKRVAPEKPSAPPVMKPVGEVVVTVKQFRFVGNTLLSAAQLAPVVAGYLDRPLDFAQLQAAAAAVADVYRAAGWVVNAYLPEQDIKDGIVTIQIVEAVFGKLRFEGESPRRMNKGQLEALVAAQQAGGKMLDANALDRALLLADDLPGIAVSGTLAPGGRFGETDLLIKTTDEPLVVGDVALDNTGARSTGAERLAANLYLNGPIGFGDLAAANVIHTRGSDYFRLAYGLPVGSDGWRVGVNASHLSYDLISSDFKGLDAHGSSESAGLEASYPILRSRMANLYLNLNADHKRFDNYSGGAATTRYTIQEGTISLNGNLFDSWGGGGANSASLSWVEGKRENRIGVTDDHFSKLRYSLARQQVITADLSLFAQLSGQASNDQLDSSERFYLGGAGGVRAYPSSEGGGDSGVLTNLELRLKLPEGFTLTGFHDYGEVRNNSGAKSYSLQGYGLSLGWQTPFGVNLKATWAHRIGNNPNPTATGKDQDGSLDKNRLWLSASLPF